MAILTHCLAVLAFFLSGAIADDPWSHGTGTYPVLGQGVVYACDGPNWTGRCWLSDESIINECLPWTMTWTWLRSIAIGPWTSCNVFTQSDCTSDSYWFHTNQADLNLVGWQFRVAGIGCYFDYDLDSKVDAASLPKPTATASVSPPLPFPAIANASEISGSTSTLVTQYSTPTAVVTPTELTPRGSPGAVFMCYGPDWTAPCIYIQPQMGTCHSLEDRAASPIGFGPDPDAICHVFNNYVCDGDPAVLEYPGTSDVTTIGYNNQLRSFYCLFMYSPPQSKVKARIGGGHEACCTTTVKVPAPTSATPTTSLAPAKVDRSAAGNAGGSYICYGPNWTHDCEYILPAIGTCYNMKTGDGKVLVPYGYGPDQDATCYVYAQFGCRGDSKNVLYPGYSDLGIIGWAKRLYSFQCFFTYDPEDKAMEQGATTTGAALQPTGQ